MKTASTENNTKKSLLIFLIFLGINMNSAFSQITQEWIFSKSSDIGETKLSGKTNYNTETQQYTIEGAGANIWFDKDGFHFLWKKVRGDFILRTHMCFIGEGMHEHRKAGIMVRDSLTDNSPHISAVVHGDGLASLQFRENTGGNTDEIKSELHFPDVLQIERRGTKYIMSAARSGERFKTIETTEIKLNDELYAGLFICSHDPGVIEKAVFSNVRIITPVKDNFIPYKDYIGSNIEILNIESGVRRILYHSPKSLQAPNWSKNGKTLVYNSEGLIYSFNIESGEVNIINTEFAESNNNDHVLSFNGELLGISHHSAEDNNKSVIYILPSTGGIPERITEKGPSYLHGWSPDDKYLTYTAERNGNYDIYKISRYKKEEIRLTTAVGLDDGSEYTPDGKYIYFNSSRTGTMQIWRMRPDGTQQEQVTYDELNDWFPHISPDGKHIVFLSFPEDVKPDDHPFYKHVYIRMIPKEGGDPRIIAYVYGGQGTINVPSWSPDSKKIAFISNTLY